MCSTEQSSEGAYLRRDVGKLKRDSLTAWLSLYMKIDGEACAEQTRIAKTQDLERFLDYFSTVVGTDSKKLWTRSIREGFQKHLKKKRSERTGRKVAPSTSASRRRKGTTKRLSETVIRISRARQLYHLHIRLGIFCCFFSESQGFDLRAWVVRTHGQTARSLDDATQPGVRRRRSFARSKTSVVYRQTRSIGHFTR